MITAIVLAAGISKRFGQPKQLLDFNGKPLIRHVVEVILSTRVSRVVVVLGGSFEKVAEVLCDLPVQLIYNENYLEGQSTSVIKGIQALDETDLSEGILFALGDQPLLKAETIDFLIENFNNKGGITVPVYKGSQGNPVIFSSRYIPALNKLCGDIGARNLIRQNSDDVSWVKVQDEGVLLDIDTSEDYERLKRVVEKS